MEIQVVILYAVINGYVDDIPGSKIADFETNFLKIMGTMHPEIGKVIADKKELSDDTEEKLKAAIEEFKKGFSAE
jgi:F-type H+-transporting ATPase subunit alpha